MTYARSVAVIHNMAHQGRGPMAELAPLEIPQQYEDLVRVQGHGPRARNFPVLNNHVDGGGHLVCMTQTAMSVLLPLQFYLDDPIGGAHMNCFKAGLICAHRIVAVSHGYNAAFCLHHHLQCCCCCLLVCCTVAAADCRWPCMGRNDF